MVLQGAGLVLQGAGSMVMSLFDGAPQPQPLPQHQQQPQQQEQKQQEQQQEKKKNLCGACCAILYIVRCKTEHPAAKCPADADQYKEWKLGMCKQHNAAFKKVDVATIMEWNRAESASLTFTLEGRCAWDKRLR
jgi:hypothetical protein